MPISLHRTRVFLLLSLGLGLACSRGPAVSPEPTAGAAAGPAAADVVPTPAPITVEHRPELAERIAATGYQGSFVALVLDQALFSRNRTITGTYEPSGERFG